MFQLAVIYNESSWTAVATDLDAFFGIYHDTLQHQAVIIVLTVNINLRRSSWLQLMGQTNGVLKHTLMKSGKEAERSGLSLHLQEGL